MLLNTQQKQLKLLAHAAAVGVTAAVTIAVTDSILTRIPYTSKSRTARSLIRLGVGGAAALALDHYNAPEYLSTGVVAGAVAMTALDAAVGLIGNKKIDPPRAPAQRLGDPWAPVPAWTLPAKAR